ncbi:hypothetical protein ACS0TY_003976 [Phlomoides rotata]
MYLIPTSLFTGSIFYILLFNHLSSLATSQMSERRYMIIHFNGKWDDTSYVGGDAQAVNILDNGCDLSTLIEVSLEKK